LVAINYRLSALGFLSSHELQEESERLGETHVVNLGLHDQRLALQWIQSSIHHFGGDPSRVTFAGESAGALSVLCHLKAGVPLFHQAMVQSSSVPPLRTPDAAQDDFDKLVEAANISATASGPEKLAALRSLTAQQLVDAFQRSSPGPTPPLEDPDFFPSYNPSAKDALGYYGALPSWCPRIIIGNTQHEMALMLAGVKDLSGSLVKDIVMSINPHIPVPASLGGSEGDLVAWSTREIFNKPIMGVASAATISSPTTKLYLYRIQCPDPFPGHLQGYAWHSYGIPFTFNQPACRVYPQLATMQDHMTTAFLDFFHGLEPWQPWSASESLMCWNATGAPQMVRAGDMQQ
jgi:carboxylesterase type B